MKYIIYFTFVFCVFTQDMLSQDTTALFKHKHYVDGEAVMPYRLHVPDTTLAAKRYPLVLFLHGAGERGNDNKKQLSNSVMNFVSDSILVAYPCFVLVPQCPVSSRWVEVDWTLLKHRQLSADSRVASTALKILEDVIKDNPVDTARIYLVGLSMGAFGVWDLITRYPDKFAAAVAICGGADEHQAKNVKCPVWAFHGAKDKLVNVCRSRNMVTAVRAAGGEVRYTEYPNVGHGAWIDAFREAEFMSWIFSQSKNDKARNKK